MLAGQLGRTYASRRIRGIGSIREVRRHSPQLAAAHVARRFAIFALRDSSNRCNHRRRPAAPDKRASASAAGAPRVRRRTLGMEFYDLGAKKTVPRRQSRPALRAGSTTSSSAPDGAPVVRRGSLVPHSPRPHGARLERGASRAISSSSRRVIRTSPDANRKTERTRSSTRTTVRRTALPMICYDAASSRSRSPRALRDC